MRCSIKSLGIDYLSIGMYEDSHQPHRTLLGKVGQAPGGGSASRRRGAAGRALITAARRRPLQGIIPVEGMNLTAVQPGSYFQMCLPTKYGGSDGAPVRCLLAPAAPQHA